MLAVIGLDIRFMALKGIDAFDYHLYRHKPISLNESNSFDSVIDDTSELLVGLLAVNHLVVPHTHLIVLDEMASYAFDVAFKDALPQKMGETFASQTHVLELDDALKKALSLSQDNRAAVLILCINRQPLDGIAALLVCDKTLLNNINIHDSNNENINENINDNNNNNINDNNNNNNNNNINDNNQIPSMKYCHSYADINHSSLNTLPSKNNNMDATADHIETFLSVNELRLNQIESIFSHQLSEHKASQDAWLKVDKHVNTTRVINKEKKEEEPAVKSTTLLTEVDIVENTTDNFAFMMSIMASVLCLDQHYRLGSRYLTFEQSLDEKENSEKAEWENSSYYFLEQSTSYLPIKDALPRRMLVSGYFSKVHRLALISEASDDNSVTNNTIANQYTRIDNGFLRQQPIKPVIFNATDISGLMALLTLTLNREKVDSTSHFITFCNKQYQRFTDLFSTSKVDDTFYCIVLLASSFETLAEQIELALLGIMTAVEKKRPWKTPVGSYFSGQLISIGSEKKRLSFIYPGVGALYVGMGRDLLRLFPQCHQHLLSMTNDVAHSLQDRLMTPRLMTKPDFQMSVKLEQALREKLENIAEAGVSYACLLTRIFQEQLLLKASSAAGYSMGEVSMFAALDCWENPYVMSGRLRESGIFTEQLSGPLKRLDSVWGDDKLAVENEHYSPGINSLDKNSPDKHSLEKITKDVAKKRWESYHLKVGIMQVESVLKDFPRVYITIINTTESLVIAGEPLQCIALAEVLNVRAIALDVPNIIHCPLAKSEYENMRKLYSLPIKQKIKCQLFSSACYLPIPMTEKAISVSISKCLTEQVDFPRLINNLASVGEQVFIEMGAGKSLSTWIERILKQSAEQITCLSVNQKNLDDHSAILKTIAPLISLGYQINLQPFFSGSLVRPVKK